jgi:hypothetical protein
MGTNRCAWLIRLVYRRKQSLNPFLDRYHREKVALWGVVTSERPTEQVIVAVTLYISIREVVILAALSPGGKAAGT